MSLGVGKMGTWKQIMGACVIGIFSSTAWAKYAVVDMQGIILNVTEGKNARAALEKEINEKKKGMEKEEKELMKLNDEWKSQAAVLSESARLKKQQEFQEKFLELQKTEKEFNQEVRGKEQKATQSIAMKVAKIVNDMAKSKQYEVVFEANTAGVLYVKDPIDITKDVIAEYEKQHGGTASADNKKSTEVKK